MAASSLEAARREMLQPLRFGREGYDKPIRLIGREKHLPYQRPPLSKSFLKGDFPKARLFFQRVQKL